MALLLNYPPSFVSQNSDRTVAFFGKLSLLSISCKQSGTNCF